MVTNARRRAIRLIIALTVLAPVVACAADPPEPAALPLLERLDEAAVTGTVATEIPPRREWRFDGHGTIPVPEAHGATSGWSVVGGVEDLHVEGGVLVGTATDELPLLAAVRPRSMAVADPIHAIEIRMRASAGTELSVSLNNTPELPAARFRGPFRPAPPFTMPQLPGEAFRTYVLTNDALTLPLAWQHHFLLQPTDAAGAEFAIESIRVVSRSEYLRSVATGAGSHSLGHVRRDALVARAPEHVTFDLDLPSQPWLDLAVGTIDTRPVRFSLVVARPAGEEVIWQREVTTARQWQSARIDLSRFAREQIALSFRLDAEEPGTLGFWGSPVVRNRGATLAPVEVSAARELLADGGASAPRAVIVILADTLRRDHLEAYGYARDTAPVLAGLAAEGALFADNISQATWTKPSIPSILTSLYPSTHGVMTYPDLLTGEVTTLNEAFRAAGYATFHAASNAWASTASNLQQGADVLYEPLSIAGPGAKYPSKTARPMVDRFLDWLDDHHDAPFFAFLQVFDPHSPLEPYPPYDTMWTSATAKSEHEASLAKLAAIPGVDHYAQGERLRMAGVDADAFVAHEIAWYDGSIKAMDAEIGRLLEGLQAHGLGDETLLAFISDHGEEFLEHGGRDHGFTTYGEMLNVPLFFWWPAAIPAGAVISETVESIDLMPTLLDLSGLPRVDGTQGQSLVPLLVDPDRAGGLGWVNRGAFSERAARTNPVRETRHVESFSLVRDGWKLIENMEPRGGRPRFELYAHREDPLNLTDLAATEPEVVATLADELALRRDGAIAMRIATEGGPGNLSPEQLRRLRALGYLR